MKLWTLVTSCAVSLLILSGCGGLSPKLSDEVVIDETLPTIELTESGVFIDMNAIAFEWKSILDERVNGIYVYKQTSSDADSELTHYKTIENRFVTHYLDSKVKPATKYAYAFKTFSKDAESRLSKIAAIESLPVLKSVSWIQSIENMPRAAKIIWRPHSNQKVKAYIVERKTLEEAEWKKLKTIDGRLSAEYIDTDLKDEYVYKYRVRVLTYDGIISSPSRVIQVITKALPISVRNINATTNLPKRIEITWEKSTTEDFSHYNLYRSEESNDDEYDLIATLHKNSYTDKIEEDGKEYFYRVSALEKNGLESIHNKLSIQGLTLNLPRTPSLLEASLIANKIVLRWNSADPRVKSFTVIKKAKSSWIDTVSEEFIGIKSKKFIDAEIGPEIIYSYQVFAVDEFNIKSLGSVEVRIKTPKDIANNIKTVEQKQAHKKLSKEVTISRPAKTAPTNIKANEEVVVPLTDF